MKKIIHLSDLHVGHRECGKRLLTMIDNIIRLQQPADEYVVVITGDIVDNANRSRHADEAVAALGILRQSGFRVLAVPGNHDYGNGASGRKKYVRVFRDRFSKTPGTGYPWLEIIDEMAFIGLDSNAEELHWNDRFFCEGELGSSQLDRLETILADPAIALCRKIVCMHHHPFDFKLAMQLKDSDELRRVVENKIDALLFGHYHADSDSPGKNYNGTWGILRCYNAGSATHKNGDAGFHRVIDLNDPDPANDYDGEFI